MTPTVYNEFEPYAAQWLRNLSGAGLIAEGRVDARPIQEVEAIDLLGVRQFHAFAGIGAWSYALRLAGWPDDLPVWTGSCPCQPFSAAGRGHGTADPRHLWPEFRRLVEECRPAVVLGEQVAGSAGRDWLDAVQADLEALGYDVGAADLCAAGVGAPHVRQRLFWVALSGGERLEGVRLRLRQRTQGPGLLEVARGGGGGGGLADDDEGLSERQGFGQDPREAEGPPIERGSAARRVGVADDDDDDGGHGIRLHREEAPGGLEGVEAWRLADSAQFAGAVGGAWSGADWLLCRPAIPGAPAKLRPVEPGTFPLAHGPPTRVGRIRAYGNAIVPQVAAEFIGAVMDVLCQ